MEAVQGQAFEHRVAKALVAAQFKSPQSQCQPTCYRCVNKDTFEKTVHKERANTQFLVRINTKLNSFLPKVIFPDNRQKTSTRAQVSLAL